MLTVSGVPTVKSTVWVAVWPSESVAVTAKELDQGNSVIQEPSGTEPPQEMTVSPAPGAQEYEAATAFAPGV
jgi:hypothetical protein